MIRRVIEKGGSMDWKKFNMQSKEKEA